MSTKTAAGEPGSGHGAQPWPRAGDQECLFPIQPAKALNPAKPQCLFLPLASQMATKACVRQKEEFQ